MGLIASNLANQEIFHSETCHKCGVAYNSYISNEDRNRPSCDNRRHNSLYLYPSPYHDFTYSFVSKYWES